MNSKLKKGISNSMFLISVIVLIVVAASGFALYAVKTTTTSTITSTTTTQMMTSTISSPEAYEFTPESGSMISSAWALVAPVGMGDYALSVHAEGLESNGTYIVEGTLSSGSMQVVPVANESMNMNYVTASEFQANSNGTGNFWIECTHDPTTTFENLELVYLPGMGMQNATVVATTSFATMMTTTSESMT